MTCTRQISSSIRINDSYFLDVTSKSEENLNSHWCEEKIRDKKDQSAFFFSFYYHYCSLRKIDFYNINSKFINRYLFMLDFIFPIIGYKANSFFFTSVQTNIRLNFCQSIFKRNPNLACLMMEIMFNLINPK